MGLNSTPNAERIHIGIFGKRNAGKSSIINAITGQNLAIVSDVSGTTTDPVSKAMELLPLGPVLIIDTPGLDDEGELGRLRVQKSYQVLNKTDIAVLVVDGPSGISGEDRAIMARIRAKQIPLVTVMNKADQMQQIPEPAEPNQIWVSALTGYHVFELKELIAKQYKVKDEKLRIVGDILLTSFSILMARYKGDLETLVSGVTALDHLQDGDRVLISEGCTHHRQCDDIGTVKIPRWIRDYTGCDPVFETTSGVEFPDDLNRYAMIVHCGGCTLSEREMKYRIACAKDAGVPITNYGVLIAFIQGILKRSVQAFPSVAMCLEEDD